MMDVTKVKMPYSIADEAEKHRQKAEYCQQEADKAMMRGDLLEAEKYQVWAGNQFELAGIPRKKREFNA